MSRELRNIDKISYWLVVVTVLIFLAVMGCSCSGAKQNKKEESKIDSTAVVATKEVAKEVEAVRQVATVDSTAAKTKKEQSDSFTEEFIFSPIDPKEESIITDNSGKVTKYKNLKGSTRKEQKSVNVQTDETVKKLSQTQTDIVVLKEQMAYLNSEIEVVKKATAKESNEQQYNWGKALLSFWWLWLLLILLAVAAYCYVKKFNPFINILKIVRRESN